MKRDPWGGLGRPFFCSDLYIYYSNLPLSQPGQKSEITTSVLLSQLFVPFRINSCFGSCTKLLQGVKGTCKRIAPGCLLHLVPPYHACFTAV